MFITNSTNLIPFYSLIHYSFRNWIEEAQLQGNIQIVGLGNLTHLASGPPTFSWKQSRSLVEISENLYDPLYSKLISSESLPDLLIVDFLTYSGIDVADKLNITAIISHPNAEPFQESGFRIPTSHTGHSINMTWFERMINDLVFRIKPIFMFPGARYASQLRNERGLPSLERGLEEYFDRILLCYNSFAFDYPQLINPLIHYVGPLQSRFSKPLPEIQLEQSLQSWFDEMENRHKQILYVSTGTTDLMTYEVVKLFYSSFETVLQKHPNLYILWQLSSTVSSSLPYIIHERVKIVEFVPQDVVLHHPSVVAFFSHCGINSVYESILAGKPIIGLPFRNDQKDNAARVEDRKIGKRLDKYLPGLKEYHISNAISEILDNSMYKENILKLQKIINQEGGSVRAVDIIEQVYNAGYKHLIPTSLFQPWWYIDQEVGAYALYLSLFYSQFLLLRSIIQSLKKRMKIKKD